MTGINKAILIGHLGQDPDVRTMPNGDAVANVSLATSESWKDKSGTKQERTEWHRVVFFGKLAEIVGKYLRKGSKIYVEGKLQTRKWQTQDGQDRYTTEIVVSAGGTMQMLDSKGESSPSTQRPTGERKRETSQQAPAPADFDDDIPFAPYLKGAEYLT